MARLRSELDAGGAAIAGWRDGAVAAALTHIALDRGIDAGCRGGRARSPM